MPQALSFCNGKQASATSFRNHAPDMDFCHPPARRALTFIWQGKQAKMPTLLPSLHGVRQPPPPRPKESQPADGEVFWNKSCPSYKSCPKIRDKGWPWRILMECHHLFHPHFYRQTIPTGYFIWWNTTQEVLNFTKLFLPIYLIKIKFATDETKRKNEVGNLFITEMDGKT